MFSGNLLYDNIAFKPLNAFQFDVLLGKTNILIKSFSKVQRRWSETAAGEMSGESTENTVRRWSMPWEMRTRLKVPLEEGSSSGSQDGLREAIQLLSCKPGTL